MISWHKEENPFFHFHWWWSKSVLNLQLHGTSTKTPTRAWMGHWCQYWTIEDGSSILMNLMLDSCDECVNLRITHLVNLWLCWGRRIERNFWNKDSLRNKICYSSSFSLKKKKMQQTYIIFSNDKLIIRSTISIMCFIFKIFVVQLVSLNVSNKNIQSSNLIFSLLYIWIIKLLRNENIRDVHIGNTTKVWTFSFFFFK